MIAVLFYDCCFALYDIAKMDNLVVLVEHVIKIQEHVASHIN